ncbi:MAG: hypothetical protein EZS28_046021 [Streblomastix strix]|uniref:Uncharacterized protein n=1 Tax=Streblomastix strix TaxID=222440 RepID=A0A5J4TKL8_9EUKA|nr:MAG: hypothetical protein EZS28_046021 [Streblomastix strix]
MAKLLGELNFLRFQIQDASLISNLLNHLQTQAVKKGGWNCSVSLNRRVLGNLYLCTHYRRSLGRLGLDSTNSIERDDGSWKMAEELAPIEQQSTGNCCSINGFKNAQASNLAELDSYTDPIHRQ